MALPDIVTSVQGLSTQRNMGLQTGHCGFLAKLVRVQKTEVVPHRRVTKDPTRQVH